MTRNSGLGFAGRQPVPAFRLHFGRRLLRMLVAGIAVLLAACGEETAPKEQVRQWVAAAETAAEEKTRGDLLVLISPNYVDARGHSRDDIDKMLRIYFLRQQKIVLLTKIGDIRITGGNIAEVELTVAMAGTTDSALGIDADAYRFELELEAAGEAGGYKDWQLLSARWGALGDAVR